MCVCVSASLCLPLSLSSFLVSLCASLLTLSVSLFLCLLPFLPPGGWGGHRKLSSRWGGTSVPVPAKATSVNTGHPAGLGKDVEGATQGPPSPHPSEPCRRQVPPSAAQGSYLPHPHPLRLLRPLPSLLSSSPQGLVGAAAWIPAPECPPSPLHPQDVPLWPQCQPQTWSPL